MKKRTAGFTIVELLVIIVVIGILASFTIVSYAGISQKATIASLVSDLSTSANQLKLYQVEHGAFPSGLDANYCPTVIIDDKYCLKASDDSIYSFTSNNTTSPQSFILDITNNGLTYRITENSAPFAVGPPTVTDPTSASIASTSATLGANLTATGGPSVTERGTCWGTTQNPTTNCLSSDLGSIAALGTPTVSTGASPRTIAMSHDGTSVYVVSFGENSVYMYSRNTSTGALTALGTPSIAAGSAPWMIDVSPDGTSVYVVNYNDGNVSMYSRNTSTGALTSIGTVSTVNTGAVDIVVSPDNNNVYVTNGWNYVVMYSRNTSTGVLTPLGTPTIPTDSGGYKFITISNDGTSVYVSNNSANTVYMYSRNTSTGALTALGSPTIATGSNPWGITISSDDKNVYVANQTNPGTVSIYSRNLSTGTLSSAGTVANSSQYPYFVALSADGTSAYLSGSSANVISMYRRNVSNGLLTALNSPTIASTSANSNVVISPDDAYISVVSFSTNNILLYGRDTNTSFNTGIYTQARTGMPSNTLIYYRGYAVNELGTSYSIDSSFTTTP